MSGFNVSIGASFQLYNLIKLLSISYKYKSVYNYICSGIDSFKYYFKVNFNCYTYHSEAERLYFESSVVSSTIMAVMVYNEWHKIFKASMGI